MAGMTNEAKRRELQHWLIQQSAASVPLWASAAFARLPLNEQVETGGGFFRRQSAAFPDVAIAVYESSPRDVQDFALVGLADGLGVSAPEKALPCIAASTNAEMKAEAAAHLYALWTEQDSAAAAASFASHPPALTSLPCCGCWKKKAPSVSAKTILTAATRLLSPPRNSSAHI